MKEITKKGGSKMKLKYFMFSALLMSFVFLVSRAAIAQEYVAPRFAIKVGYVSPTLNVSGKGSADIGNGTETFTGTIAGRGGFAIGLETYFASTPKKEIVLGLQWAQPKLSLNLCGSKSGCANESLTFNWLHIPLTYKFKFSQSEGKPGGLYLGLGPSYIMWSKVGRVGAFGFHVKGGYDFSEKTGIDIEWSNAKKDGYDIGALGIFAAYKF